MGLDPVVDTYLDSAVNWYVMRSTGVVAWGLLTAAVVGGLVLRTKLFGRRVPPPWLLDLHRGLSGMSIAFVAVHLATVLVDRSVAFGWIDVLVPGTSAWRPAAIAAGVLSLHLLLAIQVTSVMQRRVGRTWWRRIHLTAVPAWMLATGHLVAAGTDATNVLLGVAVLLAVGLVAMPLSVRALQPRRAPGAGSRAGAGARGTGHHRSRAAAVSGELLVPTTGGGRR